MKFNHNVKYNGVNYGAGDEVPIDIGGSVSSPYTKTEITRMSTAELQTLASQLGFKDAEEKAGTELKKLLIEHFGL